VFHVKFTLACQNDLLTGANLIATVNVVSEKEGKKEVISVPVTHGDKPGSYQVSWKLEKSQIVSGTYVVDFYREVDVMRKKEGDSNEPFFSTIFNHEKKSDDGVFPTEFIVLMLLVTSYGYLSWNKMNIEDMRTSGKRKK